MTQHRAVAGLVALGLVTFVSAAAALWAFQPDAVPELTVERDVPEMTVERDVPEATAERAVPTEVPAVYRSEEAGFAVQFNDIVTPYRVMAMFVMPGEAVDLKVVLTDRNARYALDAAWGTALPSGTASWTWKAPVDPGVYPLHIDELSSGETMTLNAFVMVPYDIDDEVLNGYRIGNYERRPLRDDPAYNPPDGLVEVTPELERTLVSPHFMLGQFLCKQESSYPKYLLLREQLLLKLESILREVNERGTETPSLHVMSGYRTPHYNRSIGNRTSFSRHLYGGAADVYVDTDEDNYMDDLTGDGRVTAADAQYMASIVEEQRDEPWYRPLAGGLGIYSPAPHRGPFIHVDVRGKPVRW